MSSEKLYKGGKLREFHLIIMYQNFNLGSYEYDMSFEKDILKGLNGYFLISTIYEKVKDEVSFRHGPE